MSLFNGYLIFYEVLLLLVLFLVLSLAAGGAPSSRREVELLEAKVGFPAR